MVAVMPVRRVLPDAQRGSKAGAARLLKRCALRLVGLSLLAVPACSTPPPRHASSQPRGLKTPPAQPKPREQGPALLPAHVLAQLDDEDAAPYFARRDDEGLLLYASAGLWQTRLVGVDGAPKAEAVNAGPAPADAPVAALRATPHGYLAAWIENAGGHRTVRVLALDRAGKPDGQPSVVAQATDEIAWLDVVPNAKGALVVWEVPRDDRVDVFASALAPGKGGAGTKPAAPVSIARAVLGWQAAATAQGAVIAVVNAAPAAKPAKKAGKKGDVEVVEDVKVGSVALLEVDAAGTASTPVTVSPEPTAQIDLEVAVVDGRYVLTWTDGRDIDSSVYLAVVEPGGKVVVAPRHATPPSGEQALVSLVATPYGSGAEPGKRALLAWEDLLSARAADREGDGPVRGEGRLIHLATVGPDGALSAERAALVFSANGPPDLAADGNGFAAVTLAPAVLKTDAAPRSDAPIWPTFVRFGPDLAVRAAEPVRAAPFASTDGVPYLVRGLSCQRGSCTTLASAAGGAEPGAASKPAGVKAPLALVALPVRESSWRPPAYREDGAPLPRATAVTALYQGNHLARVAATELEGGGALSAWVTYFVEGSSSPPSTGGGGGAAGRGQDLSAMLAVRAVGVDGASGLGKVNVISQKASSLGGVAIAAAPSSKAEPRPGSAARPPRAAAAAPAAESALAWVARERGEPQVYVTKLGASGEKLAQKKLTVVPRRRGGVASEASDVAIAHDGADGWVVAWVDTRDGNAEVYVARIDRALNKTVPDRRITDAPGDAAEVHLAVRGQETWLAWSDARQEGEAAAQGEGTGDIFLARLDTKTLQKLGPETRLSASPEHSRSPVLAPFGRGVVAGWIEEPLTEKSSGGGARVAQLDEKGAPLGAPVVLEGPDAAASSITLACGTSCRGVLASAPGDAVVLSAFELTPGAQARAALKPLTGLTGSSPQDVSPVFSSPAGTSLFFADDSVSGSGRVRWMTIAWP
jgi:hypothetical protein